MASWSPFCGAHPAMSRAPRMPGGSFAAAWWSWPQTESLLPERGSGGGRPQRSTTPPRRRRPTKAPATFARLQEELGGPVTRRRFPTTACGLMCACATGNRIPHSGAEILAVLSVGFDAAPCVRFLISPRHHGSAAGASKHKISRPSSASGCPSGADLVSTSVRGCSLHYDAAFSEGWVRSGLHYFAAAPSPRR